MIDLDLTTGKGVVIAVYLVLAVIIIIAGTTLLSIVPLLLIIAAIAYLVWALAVRVNRRLTGRGGL